VVSHRQLSYWNNDVSLWSHAEAVTSDNWVAEDNLGEALSEGGRLDEALPHYQAVVALYPLHPITYLYLGSYYQQRGDLSEAIKQYQKVITLSDNDVPHYARLRLMALESMAETYRNLGDNARATECIESIKHMIGR
jgi:protein O-mannosyl-transferase